MSEPTPDLAPLLARIADALERLAPPRDGPFDAWAADAFVWDAGRGALDPGGARPPDPGERDRDDGVDTCRARGGGMYLADHTWPELGDALAPGSVALVPLGSTEQHGPHLPLGVDGYQARDLAEGIAREADVLAAPPIWYGDADHHLGFPGTV